MEYKTATVNYMLMREIEALEELRRICGGNYERKDGSKPFADWTRKRISSSNGNRQI